MHRRDDHDSAARYLRAVATYFVLMTRSARRWSASMTNVIGAHGSRGSVSSIRISFRAVVFPCPTPPVVGRGRRCLCAVTLESPRCVARRVRRALPEVAVWIYWRWPAADFFDRVDEVGLLDNHVQAEGRRSETQSAPWSVST